MGKSDVGSHNRKTEYDILRILAMFCVILIHIIGTYFSLEAEIGSESWIKFNLLDSAVRWCVPVFVMISGAFFLDPDREVKAETLFRKYIPRIATAFLFWSAIYALCSRFDDSRNLGFVQAGIDYLISVILKPRYHLWFVYMILGLYLITPILRCAIKSASAGILRYWLIIMFVFGIVLQSLRNIPIIEKYVGPALDDACLDFLCGYVFYYVAGFYFNRYPVKNALPIYAAGAMGYIATVLGNHCLSMYSQVTTVISGYRYPNITLIAIAVFVLFTNHFSKIQYSEKTRCRFETVSRLMFGVYLVHDLFLTLLKAIGITVTRWPSVTISILLTAIVIVSATAIMHLLSRLLAFRKYFM